MIKGSEKAKEAGRKAAETRAKNKIKGPMNLGLNELKKRANIRKYSKDVQETTEKVDLALKNGQKIKFIKPPLIHVEELPLSTLKDTETYTFYTDGPTKIQYSSTYRVLKISPHHITLSKK